MGRLLNEQDVFKITDRETARKLVNDHSYIVVLSQGILNNGQPFYAYVAMRPDRYESYMIAQLAMQPIQLEDYGIILYWSAEESPSEAVVKYMSNEFGLSPTWEQDMQELLYQVVDEKTLLDKITASENLPPLLPIMLLKCCEFLPAFQTGLAV